MLDDTIAAIATPLGEGGLAVVRISGPQALAVADRAFVPLGRSSRKPSDAATHTIQYGRIERNGQVIDEVLLAVMRAPRTFTREDVVEVTCHGGLLPAKLVLDTLIENGARVAEPGEFTKRAFLNGRIDLAQAEAVAGLIHSRTELALAAANEQLAGKLSRRINQLRDELMKTLAHIEAHIDFPDEDIAPNTRAQLMERLERGVTFMDELLRTANEGQVLRRGIRTAIVGRPNAGKSSLLNQLLGHDRAIVSPIPGTTRDTIEETANIRGLPIVFIDTAGLREAGDEIEAEGVRRSRASLARADLTLHVLDASEPYAEPDSKYLEEFADRKRIVVINKVDLPRRLELPRDIGVAVSSAITEKTTANALAANDAGSGSRDTREGLAQKPGGDNAGGPPAVEISCQTGQGVEQLKDAIKDRIWSGEINAEMLEVMINSRHQDALQRARAATQRALEGLRDDLTLELPALDLRIAVNAVGEIVGKTATEDLIDSIFSQFCIGK